MSYDYESRPFRLRILSPNGAGGATRTYLVRGLRGNVSYRGPDEKVIPLTDLFGNNAQEARFALEDAFSDGQAKAYVERELRSRGEQAPRVEIIPIK